ncbi:MAG: hypothetical protein HQ518_18225 [Rhodopirellula sp.]|nr:hypothetical protein [Rhodopirellula sp.]
MALIDLDITIKRGRIPKSIDRFLHEANLRTEDYLNHSRVRPGGFVPSDFVAAYYALNAVIQRNLAPGRLFCEWGSGFGVVASLASQLGFDACGIEIEESLVDAARDLADAHYLPVEFALGSYIPEGADEASGGDFDRDGFVQDDEANDAYDELQIGPDEFDVVFCYPWPSEEEATGRLFDYCAAEGALLLTYTQLDDVRIRRKEGAPEDLY